MHRLKIVGAAVLALTLSTATLAYGYVLGGWFTPKLTVADHTWAMTPHLALQRPDMPAEAGATPVAVLVPGCLGERDHHRLWAVALNEAGWATLTIDSFTPRGITEHIDLDRVCSGGRPWGFERAADVVAAVTHVGTVEGLDADRIALVGWSHGGWAVMDALTFGPGSRPTTLTSVPDSWSDGVVASVLVYPYCGFGTRSAARGWPRDIPAILFMGQADANVPPEACARAVDRLAQGGRDVALRMFADATHWFDNPGDADISDHRYDAELSQAVVDETIGFLARVAR